MLCKTLATTLFLVTAVSATASTYVCNEIYDIRQEVLKTRYSVKITELQDITNSVSYGRNYDSVLKVRIDLTATRGSSKTQRTFNATATTEDVMYNVSAVQAEGFKLWMFMDEMDQSGIEITNQAGQKLKVPMNCAVI